MSVWVMLRENRILANKLQGMVTAVEMTRTEAALCSLTSPPSPWVKVDVSCFLAAVQKLAKSVAYHVVFSMYTSM